jgi:hypothetical protein
LLNLLKSFKNPWKSPKVLKNPQKSLNFFKSPFLFLRGFRQFMELNDPQRSSKLKSVYAYKSLKSFFKKDFILKLRTFAFFYKTDFRKKNEKFRVFELPYVKLHRELWKHAVFEIW